MEPLTDEQLTEIEARSQHPMTLKVMGAVKDIADLIAECRRRGAEIERKDKAFAKVQANYQGHIDRNLSLVDDCIVLEKENDRLRGVIAMHLPTGTPQ